MILFRVVLQIPYVGLNFAVYETLKDWMMKSPTFRPDDGAELGVVTKLACGAAAGTVGQTVAYPLDVVRRRMQMVGWKDASSIITADGQVTAPVQYNGMVDAFRKTVKNEGLRALYKGLVPNSVKVRNKLSSLFNAWRNAHG
jgi:solute carrier family 25 phosphate transporter 23/24/25/41